MPFIIFFGILFIIAGIAWAFNVPVWAAILILLGVLLAAVALYAIKESLKSEKRKKGNKDYLDCCPDYIWYLCCEGLHRWFW